jgi:hypothetical protein
MLSSVNWCVTFASCTVTTGLIPPGVVRSPMPLQLYEIVTFDPATAGAISWIADRIAVKFADALARRTAASQEKLLV